MYSSTVQTDGVRPESLFDWIQLDCDIGPFFI